jgi:hypothetical protein
LLGAGTGAEVVAELAIARPKVVRKVGVLAGEPKADRRTLVKQPLLSLGEESNLDTNAGPIAARLAAFLAGS